MSQRSKRLSHLYFTPESFRYTYIAKSTVHKNDVPVQQLYVCQGKFCTRYTEEVQKSDSVSSGRAKEDFRSVSLYLDNYLPFFDVSIGLSP
jgi:hypothetical protein